MDIITQEWDGVEGMWIKNGKLSVFREAQAAYDPKLYPVNVKSGKWEVISAIVDSGATITAIKPTAGKAYKVEESEASRNGVEYEVANRDYVPNFAEKKMAVLTPEGTLRGCHSQVADISSNLQSVRQLFASKHCVLFGLGPTEDDHLIINKVSGEINRIREDGTNYLQDLLVVPPDEVGNVMDDLHHGRSPFGRQA